MLRRVLGVLLCAALAFYAVKNAAAAARPREEHVSIAASTHAPGSSFTVGHVEGEILALTIRACAWALALGMTAAYADVEVSENASAADRSRVNALPLRYPPRRLLRQLCRPKAQESAPA